MAQCIVLLTSDSHSPISQEKHGFTLCSTVSQLLFNCANEPYELSCSTLFTLLFSFVDELCRHSYVFITVFGGFFAFEFSFKRIFLNFVYLF